MALQIKSRLGNSEGSQYTPMHVKSMFPQVGFDTRGFCDLNLHD